MSPIPAGVIAQGRDVGEALAVTGRRDRQIDRHPTRIMDRPRPTQPTQRLEQIHRQRGPLSQIRQQPRPDMRHHPGPTGGEHDPRTRPGSCTWKVSLVTADQDLRQVLSSQYRETFCLQQTFHTNPLMKSRTRAGRAVHLPLRSLAVKRTTIGNHRLKHEPS